MKAQFLKIAGVKTDKEFYEKYPTEEEFFAKCGAKIKKAFPGINIPGLGGIAGGAAAAGSAASSAASQAGQAGGLMQGAGQVFQGLTGGDPVSMAIDTIQGFKAQKNRVNQARQNMEVMGFMEDATLSNRESEIQDLQEARRNSYVRPEDNVLTGEELFPIYGVGTNPLAKNGKKVIAQNGESGFMGISGQQWGNIGKQSLNTGLQYGMQKLGIGDDMGSQLGGKLGGAVGNLFGPVGGMVGQALGGAVGDLIDRSDSKIKKYNKAADRSIQNMIGVNVGKDFQNRFSANLENGGTMKHGSNGDVHTFGEGGLSPISTNPYGGEMDMIKGPKHSKGGVDMNIMGTPVEAEGGEPIYATSQGDKTIAGNLKVPLHLKKSAEQFTGEKFSGGKFKNVLKSIGEAEERQNKKIKRNIEKADNYSPTNNIDRISLQTLNLNLGLSDEKLKKLQIIKDGMSNAQEALNIENEKAKNGKKVYAQNGNVFKSEEEAIEAGFQKQEDGTWRRLLEEGVDPFEIQVKDAVPGTQTTTKRKSYKEAYKNVDKSKYPTLESFVDASEAWWKSQGGKTDVTTTPPQEAEYETVAGIDPIYDYASIEEEIKKDRKPLNLDFLNGFAPQLFRGSDAEPFDNSQLLPEVWAMANNKLEPVQAQKYNPRLRTPYDISYQDRINQNTSKARSAERMAMVANNPGALASMKAQEYMADQNVLGEQFRANQQFKDQVYSQNLERLNDADLKNLAIADTQYVRQEQAKSNTKATDLEAIKSMTDKRLKHNLENQTLRVWENMYDYRFDDNGRAWYTGAPVDFDSMWELAGETPNEINNDEWVYQRGPDGKTYKRKRQSQTTPSTATPGFNPMATNGSFVKKLKTYK